MAAPRQSRGGGEGFLIAIVAVVILAVWGGTAVPGGLDIGRALREAADGVTQTPPPTEPAEDPEAGPTASAEPDASGTYASVRDMLAQIPVRTDERIPDYRRAEFGDGWLDTDGNGCDTRNDILARDLDAVSVDSRCRVLTGTLDDPYTGTTIAFQRGEVTSQAVQIDHIVPLAQAWAGGAWQWSREDREAFANDPAELIAVDGPTNSAKGAKSLSQWTPPNDAYLCDYVANYVTVTYLYELSMHTSDKAFADQVLASC